MTLFTPPMSPPVITTIKKQDDSLSLPRNSHSNYYNNNNSTPNLFTNVSTSSGTNKAMSIMSTSSYQYASTFVTELEDQEENVSSTASIHSTPPLTENSYQLSKQDLQSAMDAHRTLLAAAQTYREQLIQLSNASANFGIALESVAKNKAAMDAGQGLQAAAGLQLLYSNHHQILADTMHKTFEVPLSEMIHEHELTIKESQKNYNMALQMVSKNIRKTEAANLQQAKRGQRDLQQYRRTLQDLTRQVDELDYIKTTYNQRIQDLEQIYHQEILHQTGWLVRAQADVHEVLASKGLADPTLEQLIQQHPDPFHSYATLNNKKDESGHLFTVLPANSLIDPLPATTINITDQQDDEKGIHELDATLDRRLPKTPFLYIRPSTESFHRHIQQQMPSSSINHCTTEHSDGTTTIQNNIGNEKQSNQSEQQ
ncbi:uncharacterized protein BX664DRAFT_333680 [Halteromyces radiatus]|uniref:uncharacterized protein n=1 Tax=Halteromyces radiatus TaxID=101107 RepID=UPI00221E7E37|nr:uncharacterized protein BX664DRAFT_333680 [Halteromyces radiatus]KAI8089702.1 hypothetical protein BX664DRAFT_333680 [Halteromyces radiatus]